MSYSPKSFFKHVKATDLLNLYFTHIGVEGFPQIDDAMAVKEKVENLVNFYNGIDAEQKEKIDRDFTLVTKLATDRGVQLLHDQAMARGEEVQLDEYIDSNVYDRSLFYYLHKPELFKEAAAVDEFYDLSGWKRFPVSKKMSFAKVQEKSEDLKQEFEKIFREEARGRYCFVEMYPHDEKLYIVISFQDYPQTSPQLDDEKGEFNRMGFYRPWKEIYFLYTPDQDELQIKYKGSNAEKDRYVQKFGNVVFNGSIDTSKRSYDIAKFKDKNFALNLNGYTREVAEWSVRALHLQFSGSGMKIALQVPARKATDSGTTDIWSLISHCRLENRMNELLVDRVDLVIKFNDDSARGGVRSVPFSINWKDTCTLNGIEDFDRKAQEILKNSGIDNGFTEEDSE